MKKIAFLLVNLSGGGGERMMLDLANNLAKKGNPVDLLLLEKKGSFVKEILEEVNVISFSSPKMFRAIFSVAAYLTNKQPDAIIATSVHMQVIAYLSKLLSFSNVRTVFRIGIPLSFRFSNFKSKKDKLVAFLAKKFFGKATFLLPNSHGIAEDIKKTLGIYGNNIRVINNPISHKDVSRKCELDVSHEWLMEKKVPVIVAAGRLREQKDFKTLIEAFSKIKTDARLIILGSGAELDRLRLLARELGVGAKIDFVGFLDNPYGFMSRADLFVLSSIHEGFPNVVLEAMACGAPVVSTDCDYGPREILAPGTDGKAKGVEEVEYGLLVPTKDSSSMSLAIDKMLSDESLRKKYSEQSLKRSRDFDMEKIIREYEEVLKIQND